MDVVQSTGHWTLPAQAICSGAGERCTGRGDYVADPFQSDVYNRIIMRYLCGPCQQDAADEI